MTLVRATEYSMNTAYVALNDDVGPKNTRQAAVDAGIPEDTFGLTDELLNVLGSASPHNIDLATAYSTIANGGERVSAHIVKKVEDSRNKLLFSGERGSSPRVRCRRGVVHHAGPRGRHEGRRYREQYRPGD